ncbi:MAG: tryptophan--tRNA ligase [Candidatus Pacebacteria bacterium]|nr:tryptophan--tRNA ligase [Candidatus Paceibacterota bacterium]
MSKKLITGVKPTGTIHIGNYFGAIKPFIDIQNQYHSSIFIADLHAITSIQDKNALENQIIETAVAYLSAGVDLRKTNIFKQSDTPEVTELAWTLSCLSTMPYIMRAHSFKDAEAKNKEINVGVFTYPILMAADILLSGAEFVPVGKDQEQHLEIARDIADKFNRTYGETFVMPKAIIQKEVATVPGIDGQKMSKSYNNTISLFATDEEIEKLVSVIPTDSTPIDQPKDPDTNNVFNIHKLILNEQEVSELRKKYETPGMGYQEAKKMLSEDLKNFIRPFREKRELYLKNPKKILKILKKGGKIAKKNAEKKMKEVRQKIGYGLY